MDRAELALIRVVLQRGGERGKKRTSHVWRIREPHKVEISCAHPAPFSTWFAVEPQESREEIRNNETGTGTERGPRGNSGEKERRKKRKGEKERETEGREKGE